MWQPMDTAPKDGRDILIIGGKRHNDLGGAKPVTEATKVYWRSRRWWVADTCYYGVWVLKPTLWQPLPSPPPAPLPPETKYQVPDWRPEDFAPAASVAARVKDAALDDARFPDPIDRLNNILGIIAEGGS